MTNTKMDRAKAITTFSDAILDAMVLEGHRGMERLRALVCDGEEPTPQATLQLPDDFVDTDWDGLS